MLQPPYLLCFITCSVYGVRHFTWEWLKQIFYLVYIYIYYKANHIYIYIYILYIYILYIYYIYMMLHVTALIYVPLDVNIWYLRAEPHIDFSMQYLIIALAGGVTITNDNLKFKKVMELESLCIVIRFPHIYLTIDVKG